MRFRREVSFGIPWTKKLIFSELSFNVIEKREIWEGGVPSRCKDGKHILMFEYDGTYDWLVRDDLMCVQDRWKLSDAYVFYSRPPKQVTLPLEDYEIPTRYVGQGPFKKTETIVHAHAIILDKVFVVEANQIIHTSNVDRLFAAWPRWEPSRQFTLRTSNDKDRPAPVYAYTLQSPYPASSADNAVNPRDQYSVMAEYLNRIHGLDIKLTNPDDSVEMFVKLYRSPEHKISPPMDEERLRVQVHEE